ncbi:Ig-like domain-containing protein [Maribacter sp. ACAM166]|uniref:Ig-like domain-containing protein n=1 Tax=Maribacter sp. ACAM166 TaxID=2508996 RepID=UPI001276E431|nr:Ig-like domain-containing protein [Maribacter sp. ACAM166]TLP75646.1 hypothetical protein ES765_15010 [Maribacter sp. ACAM166]
MMCLKPNTHSTLTELSLCVSVWLLCTTTFLIAQKAPPVANDDVYVTGLNTTLDVNTANGLLTNDTDPNGTVGLTVRATPVSGPTSGAVTLNDNGSFSYTPASGSIASASFEYLVCDDGTPDIVISRFDFDTASLTSATVGPDAISIDADATQVGCGIHIPPGQGGGSKGLDLVIPNTGNIFDFTSFRFDFEYRDQESTADIATAGNFRVYHITGNQLGLRVSVINGSTGLPANYTVTLGSFLAGNIPYTVEYDELTGNVIYTANGNTTTTNMAPPYSSLDVSLATNITIGRLMDNSGTALSALCSIAFTDTSILCDTGMVTIDIITSVITNRNITYRVNRN